MPEGKQHKDHRRTYGLWLRSVAWGLGLLLLMQPGPALGQTDEEIEAVFWRSVECEGVGQVQAYLEVYPKGRYVAEAWACLEGQLGLDRVARVLVQRGLTALDYEVGAADGLFGPATRQALREWQAGKGFVAMGYLTRAQADALIAQGREAAAVERQTREAERQRAAEATRQGQVQEAAKRQERAREWVNSLGMEFVLIEPGTFEMGSPVGEDGREEDETLHRVTLSAPFYLGKYEVTRGEFGRFVAATGYETGEACWTYESGQWEEWPGRSWRTPGYEQSEMDPVVCVNWMDAQAYAWWVSGETGETYRLPTEAEWEYAARGGRASRGYRYAGSHGLSRVGWYGENSGERMHPVGQKASNELGLYDLSGNVWEWVQDWYGDYPSGAVIDPRGPSTGALRVVRGGSWVSTARFCRAAFRNIDSPGYRYPYLGFRLARTL